MCVCVKSQEGFYVYVNSSCVSNFFCREKNKVVAVVVEREEKSKGMHHVCKTTLWNFSIFFF